MGFLSLEFLVFCPLVIGIYFLLASKYRWIWLLISSYVFYGLWNWNYLFLIIFSTLIDYWVALKIENTNLKPLKKRYLWLSIFSNLSILVLFKYLDFFNASITQLLLLFGFQYNVPEYHWLLPVGISFYTFQTLGYTIDVYRGRIKPEKHLGKFALFVSFFPQLVAGPIERAKSLLRQFHFNYSFEHKRVVEGLRLILWGVFKKLVIADRLGTYTQAVFSEPEQYHGITIWLAGGFFLIQVFCDFSAYSDMAIGIAKILGVRLSKNFGNSPYFSSSYSEFWRNWHITLMKWFRDYLYIIIRSKKVSSLTDTRNIFILFVISGIWHGANWTFIWWGVWQAVGITIENLISFKKTFFLINSKILKRAIVFSTYSVSCILFGARDMSDFWLLMSNGFNATSAQPAGIWPIVLLIGVLEIIHFDMKDKSFDEYLNTKSLWFRWAFYIILCCMVLFLRPFNSQEFIYFQF